MADRPGRRMDDEEEDGTSNPSIVILNPFWARTAEEQSEASLLSGGRLTVRTPTPPPAAPPEGGTGSDDWSELFRYGVIPARDDPAADGVVVEPVMRKLASQGSSGSSSANRRPLVKQKKYVQHSAEDLTALQQNPPVTIYVPGEGDNNEDRSDHHHLKPSAVLTGHRSGPSSPCGRGGGLLRQQLSVESKASVTFNTATVRSAPPAAANPVIAHPVIRSSSKNTNSSTLGPIEDGAELPPAFEPVATHLYGKPLQEIDPTVRDKTFVVVSNRFRKNYIHRFSASRSCFLFSPWNPLRRTAIYLSTHPFFDYVVMTTILLNCIFLAMTEPVEQAEYIFLGIYSCEMVIKAVAKGLVLDRLTYLRSPWNWLDFVVILSGYATLAVEIGNLAGLRTFRVLRALKTVSIIPGLKTIINALLKAMRQLLEVMTLIVFCLSVLALFALQVFMGELRNKCVRKWNNSTEVNITWHAWIREEEHWLKDESGTPRLCGNMSGSWHCPVNHTCLPGLGDNPNFGYTNFDTFPWSMLTTFQLITLDYWENVYNMVLAVFGPGTIIFFMVVVFFGAFYLINLMLAVVAMSYDDEAGVNNQENAKKLTDYREESTFSFDPGKLPLVLLDKCQQKAQSRNAKARKPQGNRTNADQPSQPQVAELAWALAKGEAVKFQQQQQQQQHPSSIHQRSPTPSRSKQSPAESSSINTKDRVGEEVGFTLQICEPHTSSMDVNKDCDSGVLPYQPVNFASSFNTDVGYSSETSRAPSYPSSVVFKRRTYTTKSVSQNYSSLTESIGSQGATDLMEGEPTLRYSPSPLTTLLDPEELSKVRRTRPHHHHHHHHPNGESRRLSYKRACDPDKRISMAFDSMLSGDSDLSYGSQLLMPQQPVLMRKEPVVAATTPPKTEADPPASNHHHSDPSQLQTVQFIKHHFVTEEGTETDNHWLEKRHSFQLASAGKAACNHVGQNFRRRCQSRAFSLEFWLGIYRFVSSKLNKIVQSPWMDFFITISIVLNTAFLAAEHHGMSPDVKEVLDVGNKVFTFVFTTECVLKLGALGTDFFRNGWNVFDFVIVLASLVDLGLEIVNGLSVLRGMRLMRVLRLAQSWTTMRVLLSIILSSLGALANLTFVLAIVVYIFAVIGMQLFGRDYTDENFYPDPVPRWNFKDFFHSFMMIFRILCGEWAEPLWDCMRAERSSGSEICFSIFLPALVMGNFLVLNLFLALLLNSFSCEELKSRKEEIDEDSKLVEGLKKIKIIAKATRTLVNMNSFERSESGIPAAANKKLPIEEATVSKSPSVAIPERNRQTVDGSRSTSCGELRQPRSPASRHVRISCSSYSLDGNRCNSGQQQQPPSSICWSNPKLGVDPDYQQQQQELNTDEKFPDYEDVVIPIINNEATNDAAAPKLERTNSEKSIALSGHDEMPADPPDCLPTSIQFQWCLQAESWAICHLWRALRVAVLRVVKHPVFEWSILIMIFGSSITLCFEDIYLEENPRLMAILRWTNLVFAILFAIEMILKWFALGLKYYFSSVWTTLDFVIVMVSLISVAVEDSANLSALRSLRTLRALRPLRAISRWQGMKIVVNALMFAIPAIFNVLLVCLVFWLVFSILGVQLFGGKFYKCVDEEGNRFSPQIIDTKMDCLSRNLTWKNSPIHFDHVGHAYLALFQVATFEGWMEIMADAVDVRGVDLQPAYEANLWAYLYFVVFIVCGAFFTLNLFIGVIIDNFNMLKKKYEGGVLEMFLTESQKQYYTAMKKLGRKKPSKMIRRPINAYLALFYDISMSRRFEIAIFILIFLNMVVMGVEHYGQPPAFTFVLELCNALFTTMFALEAIVKMIGLRHHYFTLPWNLFDLILVSASVVGLIMEDVLNEFPISPTLLRVVRVFRLGRVLRLVKAAKGIRKLLFALIVSLPALFNIGALLALITFIYAIIGMALFGHVTHTGALNEMVNFETFGRSMLLLFRLMTGAGWNDILNPLLVQPPDCDMNHRNLPYGDCGSPMLATLYLVSFIVLSSMIVINMYIAVLLENFNQAHHEEELGLGEEDLERFYAKWSRFDPYATQFIGFGELSDFVASLDPPLGIPRPNMAALVNLDIPIASGDRVHCLDILHALTRRVLGDVEDTEHFRKLQEQMDEKFKKQFPNRRELEVVSSTGKWKQRDTAARVIQKAYRNYVLRKLEAKRRREEAREHVQTQTSFDDSTSSFDYEPDRISLRSVLNRMSSIFHSYLGGGIGGGLSRQGSRRDTPSPSASAASAGGDVISRQSSTRRSGKAPNRHSARNSALLDVLLPGPGSRRSSVWSLGTMIVSAQVHNENPNTATQTSASGGAVRRGSVSSRLELPASPDSITRHHSSSALAPENNGGIPPQQQQRSDVIVKFFAASKDSDLNL